MARARNIKPSFFTNDVLAEVSVLGRLLFIGLWTIADREGRLEDRPKKIKAEVLPYDECDCDEKLSELEKHDFITRYESGNVKYIQILTFTKHQNPHVKEAESTIPAPDMSGANTVQDTALTGTSHADSLLPITDSLNPITPFVRNDVADVPHKEILSLYETHLPMLMQIKVWNANRASLLKTRWREDKTRQTLDWWTRFFGYIAKSDFLTGKSSKWQADLPWILKAENFAKIIEGKYENKAAA